MMIYLIGFDRINAICSFVFAPLPGSVTTEKNDQIKKRISEIVSIAEIEKIFLFLFLKCWVGIKNSIKQSGK